MFKETPLNYFLLFVTFLSLSGRGSHREVINQLLPTPLGAEADRETRPACVPIIPGAKTPGTPGATFGEGAATITKVQLLCGMRGHLLRGSLSGQIRTGLPSPLR